MSFGQIATGTAALIVLSAQCAAAAPALATSNVNMRQGPGTNFPIITTIPGGSTVEVSGCQGEWCAVVWHGKSGYAIATSFDQGASPPPPGAAAPPPGARGPPPGQGGPGPMPPPGATAEGPIPASPPGAPPPPPPGYYPPPPGYYPPPPGYYPPPPGYYDPYYYGYGSYYYYGPYYHRRW
ncbi:MAG TPA: SH3 domain-containing protein [Xanthobacteraceae bacterium]|nr:SH3 domain-containing protein [Xanthobacteraceae bacterium]